MGPRSLPPRAALRCAASFLCDVCASLINEMRLLGTHYAAVTVPGVRSGRTLSRPGQRLLAKSDVQHALLTATARRHTCNVQTKRQLFYTEPLTPSAGAGGGAATAQR